MRKKTIKKLKELGYYVDFYYNLDDRFYLSANMINPNFKDKAFTECMISKDTTTTVKQGYTKIEKQTNIQYIGKALCNKVDKFIPRIGKAIAFKRALSLVPEFKKEE